MLRNYFDAVSGKIKGQIFGRKFESDVLIPVTNYNGELSARIKGKFYVQPVATPIGLKSYRVSLLETTIHFDPYTIDRYRRSEIPQILGTKDIFSMKEALSVLDQIERGLPENSRYSDFRLIPSTESFSTFRHFSRFVEKLKTTSDAKLGIG